MHTYALQNTLYQSVQKKNRIDKIKMNSKIDTVKGGGGNLGRNIFFDGVCDAFSLLNVSVCPYYREAWTFHAKGIWMFSQNGNLGGNLGGNRDSNILNSVNSKFMINNNRESNSDNGDNNQNGNNTDNVYTEIPRNILRNVPIANNIPLAASYIGSSNFGERSHFRDFELGFVLHTSSPKLSNQLQEECCRLEEYSSDAKLSLKEYSSPSKSTEWYIPYLTKMLRSYL